VADAHASQTGLRAGTSDILKAVMNQRLTAAGTLVVITMALFVIVIRHGGAPARTHPRTSLMQLDTSRRSRPVNLRSLEMPRPSMDGAARYPFAFSQRPHVVRTRSISAMTNEFTNSNTVPPPVSSQEAALLAVRFVGTLETRDRTWAVFSDCGGYICATAAGDRVLGLWRVLAIEIDSVSVETIDGQQITVRMTGCTPW
jgi:hypothetical protein